MRRNPRCSVVKLQQSVADSHGSAKPPCKRTVAVWLTTTPDHTEAGQRPACDRRRRGPGRDGNDNMNVLCKQRGTCALRTGCRGHAGIESGVCAKCVPQHAAVMMSALVRAYSRAVCKAVCSPYAITRRQRLFALASESGSLGSRRTLGSPSAAREPADEPRGLASRRSPQVQQRSTATSPEISRHRRTSMDRQQG